ncbi:MAG: glycerol-3-phosphate 1-O-acyltransferase PlsY [Oscillospiraceae bacterium]|nr:glycerol-3-phosphate 1-O-acyltransferase PlsY [Oscillospiraceae bacterium]
MEILCFIIMIIAPYLISGINSAIIVTKIKSGEDIRKLGSSNAGLTNTLRTQGKTAAAFVLFGDVLKGVLSVFVVRLAFYYLVGTDTADISNGMSWVGYVAGIMASLGHVFPIYYKFRGGKGVLVTVSVLYAIDWISASILLGLFIIIVVITRYVSLGSVIAGSCYPLCVLIIGNLEQDPAAKINALLGIVIAFILVFMHRQNIVRLINKTEKKLSFRKRTR